MWYTPTLAIFDSGWDSVGEPWNKLRTWYRDLAGLAHRKGVRLLAGTDLARKTGTVQPGNGLHDELEHLVDIGLEPWEALRAATLYPARAFGRESEVGAIKPGMIGFYFGVFIGCYLTLQAPIPIGEGRDRTAACSQGR